MFYGQQWGWTGKLSDGLPNWYEPHISSGLNFMPRPQAYWPYSFGPNYEPHVFRNNNGSNNGFGPPHGNELSAPSMAREPVSNNVQVDPTTTFRPHGPQSGGVAAPWRNKPRARVFLGDESVC